MAPLSIAFWVFLTHTSLSASKVGAQVEQPFEIIPMTQPCNIIMANLEKRSMHRHVVKRVSKGQRAG